MPQRPTAPTTVLLSLVAAVAMPLFPSVTGAQEADDVTVRAAGCPDASEVIDALGPLMPGARAVARGPGESADLEVTDLGPRYRVEATGEARINEDAERDCAQRARAAAVFAALRLRPPEVALPATPDGKARAPSPWRADLELAGLGEVGLGGSVDRLTGGGGLRLAIGYRWLGVALGAAGLAPSTVELTVGRARIWRVPFDLGLRAVLRRGRLAGELEAGFRLYLLSIAGEGLSSTQQSFRVEPGVHAAVRGRLRVAARWELFAGVVATWIPAPHELTVDPVGAVGTTPAAWLGVEGGVSLRLD